MVDSLSVVSHLRDGEGDIWKYVKGITFMFGVRVVQNYFGTYDHVITLPGGVPPNTAFNLSLSLSLSQL